MKQLKLAAIVVLVALLATCALVACQAPIEAEPLTGTIIADYTKTAAERSETFASGSKGYSWENGEPFNVWWNPNNVSYDGKLSMYLSEMTTKELVWNEETGANEPCLSNYYGAEVRSEHYYGYGDFQVRMKPAKIAGTASTFFTCTGPYDVWYNEDGSVAKTNHHDEIDIEFLGKDTTKVQFNYFANGKGGHEYMYNLGFDASEEYHDYGFRWTEESITWFVDGQPVYQVLRANIRSNESWPQDPGRVVMNYWCGTNKTVTWMGRFKDDYSGHADYEWVKCSAEQQPDPISSKPGQTPPSGGGEIEVPAEGWTSVSLGEFWTSTPAITVDTTDGIRATHNESVAGWTCFGTALPQSYSWVKLHVKNNSSETANLRIDIKKNGGENGVAGVVANDNVSYNAYDAAVSVALAAGEETDVVAQIKEMFVDQIVIFLNSTSADLATVGDITISDIQGIVANIENPNPGSQITPNPEDPQPAPVDAPEGWNTFDLSGLSTWDGDYQVAVNGHAAVVWHTAQVHTAYVNVNKMVGWSENNNVVRLVVENKGTEDAYVKVGVQDASYACVLASATINGETATDIANGAYTTIAAGQTATFQIVVDLARKPGAFFIAINSEGAIGTNAETGIVSVNAYCQAGEGGGSVVPDPTPDGEWIAWDISAITPYASGYTVVTEDGITTISHTAAVQQYLNANAVYTFDQSNQTIKVILKNVGDAESFVKVGVQEGGEPYGCVLSAAYVNGVELSAAAHAWGVGVTLAAGEEATVVMVVDLNRGPNAFFVALNSENAQNAATGAVTVQAFTKVVGDQPEQPKPELPAPNPVAAPEGWNTFDLAGLSTWAGDYQVSTDGHATAIWHTAQVHTAYVNVNKGVTITAENNVIRLVVENIGHEAAYVKVGVQEGEPNYACVLVSATINGEATTDIANGVYVTVAAGETVTIEFVVDLQRAPKALFIAINSEGAIGTNAETGCILVNAYSKAFAVEE